jgi:hypothetical protein
MLPNEDDELNTGSGIGVSNKLEGLDISHLLIIKNPNNEVALGKVHP